MPVGTSMIESFRYIYDGLGEDGGVEEGVGGRLCWWRPSTRNSTGLPQRSHGGRRKTSPLFVVRFSLRRSGLRETVLGMGL